MGDRALAPKARGRPGSTPVMRASQLAAIIRPELPDIAREIIAEIRARIPEYARPMEGPYGLALRQGVQQALTSFVDAVTDPSAPHEQRDHMCKMLGQYEAQEGRSLDSLQAAYRIGVHVGWRRVMDVGLRCAAPSSVMSGLADAMLSYMDELASLSLQGYLEEKARSSQSQQEWRQRLLRLILERPAAPARAISELAELVGWQVPGEVTLVALEPGRARLPELPDQALAEFGGLQPHLLLPGRVSDDDRPWVERMLTGGRGAIGLAMPVAEAWHSLRWARRALALGRAGMLGAGDLTFCEDFLVELWLLADDALIDQLARRHLGALAALTSAQRQRLAETFAAWLETSGTAPEMAARLQVHPQTVRYRMRNLERTLGGQLKDPDARFAIELVLRATRLREKANEQAVRPPAPS
ncbi:MAG TPA: helix-turn-helix domain-containing protein [Streptosporangiaceae bacterium]|nr:helix-turn-helix domain-containing protein [Streptosporangiaceae bacterium]